jgi:polysaccharide export outer membrane protein
MRSLSALFLTLTLWSLQLLAQTPLTGETQQSSTPASAAVTTEPNNTAAPRGTTQYSHPLPNSNAKLGVGDLIEVVVFGVPDLSTKSRISGSGDLYLPLIDYVHVADLTTDEAQELIQKRLDDGGFVRSPHVSIFVDEAASQSITVLGEVNRPGPYVVTGERRLFDVFSVAGGLNDKAGRVVTIEHRNTPGERVELQLSSNLADDSKSNVPVFPGDTIIVSRAGIIYVVGDVGHPSGFMIDDVNLTVLKALALAGGNTRTSALNKTKILRQTPNGVQEIPVQLKKIMYAKSPDVALVKGDILFIPGSATKAAAYRTAEAAVSVTAALAVIAVHP